ncbi:hypothetical protein E4K72_21805 [Oxalobacteraceae bacterium OM1]|nr:hypothetical protein E4K72_21805 [Oxalobacteraceae bacterium OM1]
MEAALKLDGVRPFPLSGTARAAGTFQDKSYRLDATLSNTLAQPLAELTAIGDGLDARARVQAAPFDPVPVREAHVTINAIDPKQFLPSIPHAQLDVQADLQPLPGSETQLRVGGNFRIRNRAPAAYDKDGIPATAASGTLLADAAAQTLSDLRIDLAGGGQLTGNAHFAKGGGTLELEAADVDPHALHSALLAESVNGPLTLDFDAQGQRIAVDLQGRDIALLAHAGATPAAFTVDDASLASRGASLALQGTLARTGPRAFSAKGKVQDFNPQAFLARKQKYAAARINGDLSAEGSLQPELSARLRFDIRDSSYAERPLSGRGTVQLAGKRLLDSDARLEIAGNTVQLHGAFGLPGQQLRFAIDAPALDRLGVGARGLLQAEGTLGGTLERPALDATAQARELTYAGYRVGTLDARARTAGVPGRDANASILLDLDAAALAAPDVSLNKLTARIDGTYAAHALQLQANGRLRGNPLTLGATARGKLEERPEGYAWSGTLQSLENRGRPAFALEAPMDVAAAPGRVLLGSTRLTLEKAAITLDRFRYEGGEIATAGRLDALDAGQLLELQRTFTGKTAPIRSDMVFDGRWDLALAGQSRGSFALERKRGDVRVVDGTRVISLGLQTLRMQSSRVPAACAQSACAGRGKCRPG